MSINPATAFDEIEGLQNVIRSLNARLDTRDARIEEMQKAIINLLVAADDIEPSAFKVNWDSARDQALTFVTRKKITRNY